MKHYSNYFYGNKVSDYGIEHGYVDYRTLAKAFDGVLANDIIEKTNYIVGEWEQESGIIDNSDEIDEIREQIEELEEQRDNLEGEEPDEDDTDEYIEKYNEWEKKLEELENQIAELEEQIEELEEEQENSYYPEIFQYYIVDGNGAEILKEAEEIVFYNYELDMYVWGVTHWGTSWDYVLTNIKICKDEDYTEFE